MAKFYNSSEIPNLDKRQIFFDANILLYIFLPTGSSWERQYSVIFNRLLKQKNEMAVDFIVISEVVNRAVRIEYEKHLLENNILRKNLSFKRYRDCQDGQDGQDAINWKGSTHRLHFFKCLIGSNRGNDSARTILIESQ